jgi:protein-tyrosine phosphatase/nicotinamidase-related amidase/aminoglycoside phosphotransferase (APT) family kinase protein
MSAVLITQCLQQDFVAPVGRYDPLPNLLHVGFEEARRLMGENPAEGPVARVMRWAQQQPDAQLKLVHIRDWHDATDPAQQAHLRQFGVHCVRNTRGAQFAFADATVASKAITVIDSPGLNDFLGTSLAADLAPVKPRGRNGRIGVMGVWTEAKVSFLAYELRTRFPDAEIAVCSALAASASRNGHFLALQQLRNLLGVRIIDSVGAFVDFLGGTLDEAPLQAVTRFQPALEFVGDLAPNDTDRQLLAYLFRDCSTVRAKALSGGFSGNLVLACESTDRERRRQAPHVVKIGARDPIGRERASFEQIEQVLGNSAPRITDFADWGERGAIKYRYAAMGEGVASTFQRLYRDGLPQAEVNRILDTVFGEQLARLYSAPEREAVDLFEHYSFSPRWAPHVRTRVEALLGTAASGATLALPGGVITPNICQFYEATLEKLPRQPGRSWWFAHVHGDLNGANIILDAHRNVWLIDFFHTDRGHILKDLAKLENDLLFIWTPLENAADLAAATRVTDVLLGVRDLAGALPDAAACGIHAPALVRAWETVRKLRGFYPALIDSDRDPLQLIIAQLRYAVHSLGFEECNHWQKLWALYTAGQAVAQLEQRLSRSGPLRIDWLTPAAANLGLTLLPGRRDYGRDLHADLATLKAGGVTHVLSLLTADELASRGVEALPAAVRDAGLAHRQDALLDQAAATPQQMDSIVAWLDQALTQGGRVAVHCMAGLGRSGMVAACYLTRGGMNAGQAIQLVRDRRSPRAIETAVQAAFVTMYAQRAK